MAFPADFVNRQVAPVELPAPVSDPGMLAAAVDAVLDALEVDTAVVLPGIAAVRADARAELAAFVDASGLPFTTMFMAKSVLDEQHPDYVGMYDGALMNKNVAAFVESRDVVVDIASPFSDFNSGAFTANIDPARIVTIAGTARRWPATSTRVSRWPTCWPNSRGG